MIKSFNHKGLQDLWEKGHSRKIDSRPAIQSKLRAIMETLDSVESERELDNIGKGVHRLKGREKDNKGDWAVYVTGNYRLTFNFDGTDAHILDYEDYH
ncbi:type II toxin-antitoxin system RelE/ParE family toxin (plasmid) [Microbulbifer sp. TRSA002]|uniref:type II toxin-antitoxin system RelE/ParE family toxin n=1 Tax=Microbulbifer sp. TRSA002 TaxID=3243382 RepID=UPI004039BBC5